MQRSEKMAPRAKGLMPKKRNWSAFLSSHILKAGFGFDCLQELENKTIVLKILSEIRTRGLEKYARKPSPTWLALIVQGGGAMQDDGQKSYQWTSNDSSD